MIQTEGKGTHLLKAGEEDSIDGRLGGDAGAEGLGVGKGRDEGDGCFPGSAVGDG